MSLSQKRLLFLFAGLTAWALVVVVRLAQIQLVRHKDYVQRAARQQDRTIDLDPVRGSILDARGRVLAESVSAASIYADPQAVTDPKATARALAAIPGLGIDDPRELAERLAGNSSFAWVARQLPLDVADEVRKKKLPGIYFIDDHRRSYPRGELAAHVIGYVGLDGRGLAGIEQSFQEQVKGKAGRVTVLRDARRGVYLVGGQGANRAVDGNSVILTIDSVIQFIAERALAKAMTQYRAATGSVIVMDPRDGAILAMAAAPTFDPNHFRDSPEESWRNSTVQAVYEPGSTFKIITASAGLEEGLVTPSQIIDCGNGAIRIANVEIHEHGGNRYGLMTFEDVLAHSSNVGSIRVGMAVGPDRFYRWIRKFGFGERTGIPLPGETAGILHKVSKWSAVSNASISIGQEISVTPLQLVRAVAAVANGGVRVEPRLVDRVVDANGNTIARPEPPKPVRVMSEKSAAVLNEMLKAVVARGTGQNAKLAEHIVAGKTGTAEKATRGGYSLDKVVASFAGYVPADRPRLVILAVIDEPKGAQYGGTIAAPIFHEVAEGTLRYLGVAPSIPTRSVDAPVTQLAAFSHSKAGQVGGVAGVPDLRGLDARAAIARAVASGLTVRAVGSGVVQTQNPLPGEALPQNKQILLSMEAGR